jgi:hypothetical protein
MQVKEIKGAEKQFANLYNLLQFAADSHIKE